MTQDVGWFSDAESAHVFLECQLLTLNCFSWSLSSRFGDSARRSKCLVVHYQTVGNAWRNCEPSTVSWQHGTTGSGEIYETGWLKPQPCCSWVVVMWLFQCCFMAAAVSREISGTKAVEPRYIQATYTELHCSDTSNCRDSAEVALSQVEDSRQFSQFSWKGVLFCFGRSDGTSPQSASGFLVCDLWRVLSVCGGCPCSMVERRDFGKWNWVALKTWNTLFFRFSDLSWGLIEPNFL